MTGLAEETASKRDAREALAVEHVTFRAGGRVILDDVSIDVRDGETLALLGPSGCGKTTLLRVIAGLERPDAGRVVFEGGDVTGVPAHRRRFGMMFQDFAIFPHLDVTGNVAFGLRHSRLSRRARAERVAELLELVGMTGYERRTTEALSGGERQRVALARALAPDPAVLMLDEPLASLDRALRERLLLELKEILSRVRAPAIYVTHDQGEAFAIADHVALMRAGRVVRRGTPREIHADPGTEFVARYLGMTNIVAAKRAGDELVTSVGRWPSVPGTGPEPEEVRLLLREEGVRMAEFPANGVVTGVLRSRLFQGLRTRVQVETAAGVLEFGVPGEARLPADGSAIHLLVPRVQVLQREPEQAEPGSPCVSPTPRGA